MNVKNKRNRVPLEYIIKEGGLDQCVRKAFLEEGIHGLTLVEEIIQFYIPCSQMFIQRKCYHGEESVEEHSSQGR